MQSILHTDESAALGPLSIYKVRFCQVTLLEGPHQASHCALRIIQLPSGASRALRVLARPSLAPLPATLPQAFRPSQNMINSSLPPPPPRALALALPQPGVLFPDLNRPPAQMSLSGEAVLATCHPVLLSSPQLLLTDIFEVFMYPLSMCHPLTLHQGPRPVGSWLDPQYLNRPLHSRCSIHIYQIMCLCILYVCLELQCRPRCVIFPC